MAWTMCEGCGIPRTLSFPHGFPKEVSPLPLTLHLSSFTRKQFYRRLQEAYTSGSLKLVKPIHALLALSQGQSVCKVADMLALGEQSVRNYRNQDLFKGMASLVYKSPPGRPSKLTKSQRQQLSRWIQGHPQDVGYTSGCWNTPMIQELIWREFRVQYNPHYLATLLKNMGFAYQKARFVSDHLNEAKRLE
ncbi:hypothetical protein C2W62_44045 [Candidatus Entotheonella serta]|nr:hypothetical protein C2W62_44045 [Candidatus Entotheonella serta]